MKLVRPFIHLSFLLLTFSFHAATAQYIGFSNQDFHKIHRTYASYQGMVGLSDEKIMVCMGLKDTAYRLSIVDIEGIENTKGDLSFSRLLKEGSTIIFPERVVKAFIRNGYTFVFCKDKRMYVYDPAMTLVTDYELKGLLPEVIDINADATILAHLDGGAARLVDPMTGKEIRKLIPEKPEDLNSFGRNRMAFAPEGNYFFMADLFTLYYWDLTTGEQKGLYHVEGVGKKIVDFSTDRSGSKCVFVYYSKVGKKEKDVWGYRVVETATGKVIREMEWEEELEPLAVSMDPTGSIFCITTEEEKFRFYALDKMKEDEYIRIATDYVLRDMAVLVKDKHPEKTKFHFHPKNPYVGILTQYGIPPRSVGSVWERTTSLVHFCRMEYIGKKSELKAFGDIPTWPGE